MSAKKTDGPDLSDDALTAKLGKGQWRRATTPDGRTIVVKRPGGADYRRFMGIIGNDKPDERAPAMMEIVLKSTVFPDWAEAKSILDDFGGLMVALCAEVQNLAGADIAIEGKG